MFPNAIVLEEGLKTALFVTLFCFLVDMAYSFCFYQVLKNYPIQKDGETNTYSIKSKGVASFVIVVLLMSLISFVLNFICLLIVSYNYAGFYTSNIFVVVLLAIAIGIFTSDDRCTKIV
jgi:uncharacterized membrane protein